MEKKYFSYENKPKRACGATSLLEVLFVLIVAMAFAIGLYRQFSSATLEKAVNQRNDEIAAVIKIANIFYFSVDPATISPTINTPVRFCNETASLNTFFSLDDIYNNKLCSGAAATTEACSTISALINQIKAATDANHETYSIVIGKAMVNGQLQPDASKFLGILLESEGADKPKNILDKDVFNLYKGKLTGNPQYIVAGQKPLAYVDTTVSTGGIFWVIAPSQGNLSLFSESKLSNANMQALNNLASQWTQPGTITKSDYKDYAFACVDNYQH
ncbi:MAG: hypothetical protein K0R12_1108 [Gammaproteobacteria bacterium]|jgi:hypothetical protein|nr:hypothetical protein [Gammaproteobacteria bacterium]